MMSLIRFYSWCGAAVFTAALQSSAFSQDIQTRTIDEALIAAFQNASIQQAQSFLTGYSILVDLNHQESQTEGALSGLAVLYIRNERDILLWGANMQSVGYGRWHIFRDSNGHNEVCINIKAQADAPVCSNLDEERKFLLESTPGNPFELEKDAAVPFEMKDVRTTLDQLEATFKLQAQS